MKNEIKKPKLSTNSRTLQLFYSSETIKTTPKPLLEGLGVVV